MEKKQWYYYEVTKPFKWWYMEFNVGDLVGYYLPITMPPFYRKYYMKLLNSPVYK